MKTPKRAVCIPEAAHCPPGHTAAHERDGPRRHVHRGPRRRFSGRRRAAARAGRSLGRAPGRRARARARRTAGAAVERWQRNAGWDAAACRPGAAPSSTRRSSRPGSTCAAPSLYPERVLDDARAGRRGLHAIPVRRVRRGDLVIYKWPGSGDRADHFGIVTRAYTSALGRGPHRGGEHRPGGARPGAPAAPRRDRRARQSVTDEGPARTPGPRSNCGPLPRERLPTSSRPCRACRRRTAAVLLGHLGDDRLGGEDVLGDRRGVLERGARDHRRVDDAGRDEIDDLARGGVEAVALLGLADVVDDDRALEAGVLRDLAERLLERAQDDAGAGALVIDRRSRRA